MQPLKLIEPSPGKHSLLLHAGTTAVDDLIEELGYEPGGYFWLGVAQMLVSTEAPALDGRFSYEHHRHLGLMTSRIAADECAAEPEPGMVPPHHGETSPVGRQNWSGVLSFR